MQGWEEDIQEHLANLHSVQIKEGIIKPAIKQVIEDYKYYLDEIAEPNDDAHILKLNRKLLKFWQGILKKVEEA